MKFHCITTRMAKFKSIGHTKHWESVEELELQGTESEKGECSSCPRSLASSYEVKHTLNSIARHLQSEINKNSCSKTCTQIFVTASFMIAPKVEITQIPFRRQMDKW